MIRAHSGIILSLALAFSAGMPVHAAQPSQVIKDNRQCTKPYFKEHRDMAILVAILSTLALAAQPTTGTHEVSAELFFQDPVKFVRNAWGWFGKDPKVKSIDPVTGMPVWKPGYESQGLVGFLEAWFKKFGPLAGLTVFIKNIDPWCETYNLTFGKEAKLK